MSLLTIVSRACRLLSIPVPSTVVASTDNQVLQLFELANEEGAELSSIGDWQVLREQYTFTTTADPEQTAAVPDDWQRFIANSFFNRTTRRSVIGPITPQQWQAIQAQPQLNRVFLAFIQRHGKFLITPTPAAGETIAYEYVSKNWAKTSDGTPIPYFVSDSDETYLDEWLFVLGLRWRFLKSKGLDYAEDFRTYQSQRTQVLAWDGGNGQINTTGDGQFLLSPNLPVGSFPGP